MKTKTIDAPQLTSATRQATCKSLRGKLLPNALGYMNNCSNSISKNGEMVGIYSSCYANGNGFSIVPKNYMRTVALFTARKSIKLNWINSKDEYMEPNV